MAEIVGREKTTKLTFEEISQLNDRKLALKGQHQAYLKDHPEMKNILSDFMCAVLVEKPDDVFAFAKIYFESNRPTKTKRDPTKHYKPVVVGGPPGAGKGTLIKMLMKAYPNNFGFAISHTSREPRPGEEDGVHYHFSQREEIISSIRSGKFIEWAEIQGAFYGTSVAAVDAVRLSGKICILDIDLQGVRSVKKSDLRPNYVFVEPPSLEKLEERLRDGGNKEEEQVQEILKKAVKELEYGRMPGNFQKSVINGEDLDAAFTEMLAAMKDLYEHLA